MAVPYISIPTSAKSLSDEVVRLVDLYKMQQLSEEELATVVKTWEKNVPKLLLSKGDSQLLSPSLVRYIGKRRAGVITTLLGR